MTRLGGFTGREVARVAEGLGWRFSRTRGDHMVYMRPDDQRRLSIPDDRNLPEGTARSLVRTMGLTVDEFLRLAKK